MENVWGENQAFNLEVEQVSDIEDTNSQTTESPVDAHYHQLYAIQQPAIQQAASISSNDETTPKLLVGSRTPEHDVPERFACALGNNSPTESPLNEKATPATPVPSPRLSRATRRPGCESSTLSQQNARVVDHSGNRNLLETPATFSLNDETTPKSPVASPRQSRRSQWRSGENFASAPQNAGQYSSGLPAFSTQSAGRGVTFEQTFPKAPVEFLRPSLLYQERDNGSTEETLPKFTIPSSTHEPSQQAQGQYNFSSRSGALNFQTEEDFLGLSSPARQTRSHPPQVADSVARFGIKISATSSSLPQPCPRPSTIPFQEETDPKMLQTLREFYRHRSTSEHHSATGREAPEVVYLSQSAPSMASYDVTLPKLPYDFTPPSLGGLGTGHYGCGTIREHTEPKLVVLAQPSEIPQNTPTQSVPSSIPHASRMPGNPTFHMSANSHEERIQITKIAKCEELKSLLEDKVTALASEESSLAEISQRPIIPVNLAIVSKPQQIDDEFQAEGHYHRREDLAKVYERPESDITCVEMFSRSKETAEQEADRKFQPDEVKAKLDYVEKHGNTVAVIGRAGIGKTTSAKKWALGAVSGRLCGNLSFIFYVMIRFIDFSKQMTFLQFLLCTILPEWTCSPEEEFIICNAICSNRNVLVIFDGLDEAAFESFANSVSMPLLHSKSKAENFLKHLAGGNLLPRARKIFTSRPAQLYKLNPLYRPKFIIEILGLTPRSQDELGRQICGNKYPKIQEALMRHNDLFAYCYVPVNFILTLNYLMNYDGDIQFVSLTRVLAFSCAQYSVTEHLKGEECELDKLAKMAWDGFLIKKVIFDYLDFKRAGIKGCTADAFLNTSVTKHVNPKLTILDGHKIRYFSHLIWQEFFAGVYLMMIMPLEEFKAHYTELAKDRWEVVAKFSFGICDRPVFSDLRSVIASFKFEHLNAKKSLLKELMTQCLNRTRTAVEPACSWAHESNDSEIASVASSSLPERLDLRYSSFTPNDAENLSFVLQDGREKPLKNLDLSDSKVDDSGVTLLARCVHNIEELMLRRCDIKSRGADELSGKICVLQKPLKKLDLSFNKIGDSGTASLARCVHNIEELELGGCEAESEGADKLSSKIQVLEKPLKKLDLSENKIGDKGASSLGCCLHNTERLILKECGIKTKGVDDLSEKIRALENPMKQLDLSHNKIGDLEATSLANCIHNFEELVLIGCEIGRQGAENLSNEIKTLRKPLKKLDLSYNKIGDLGATSLAHGVHNIEELVLRGCEIRSKGMIQLSKKMLLLQVPMKKLDLSRNMIGDFGATLLAHCIHYIEELELDGCEIGNKGVKEIAKRIQVLHQPMERLDLTWNNLTDESAESLARCVHNIKALYVSDCGFTKAGMSLIRSKSRGKESTNYRYI